MTRDRENGYILAGVMIALLLISLTATALISLSVNDLRRTASLEERTEQDALLRGALRIVANELATPPRSRELRFDSENFATYTLDGFELDVRVRAERWKIDLNQASEAVIRQQLNELNLPQGLSERVWGTYQTLKEESQNFELVDDVLPSIDAEAECLHPHFTVFGGWDGLAPRPEAPDFNGTLLPGERVQIMISHPEFSRHLSAVMLIIGPVNPAAETLDLRLTPARDSISPRICHAIQ